MAWGEGETGGGDANLMPTHGRCSRAGMIFGHHLLLDYCLKVRNFDPEEKELLQIRISWGLDWMGPHHGAGHEHFYFFFCHRD